MCTESMHKEVFVLTVSSYLVALGKLYYLSVSLFLTFEM